MKKEEALNMAIFALNTLAHPDASDQADMERLDAQSDEVITKLTTMRDRHRRKRMVRGDLLPALEVPLLTLEQQKTRWFVNEDGGVYEYDRINQPVDFPNDCHTPHRTQRRAEMAADGLTDPPAPSKRCDNGR